MELKQPMRLFQRPRTLKDELQILFLAVGSAFLVLATVLLYQNGQASLRRQVIASASTAAETAAALISLEDHQSIRSPEDMDSRAYRNIIRNLGRSEERRVGKECRSRWSP